MPILVNNLAIKVGWGTFGSDCETSHSKTIFLYLNYRATWSKREEHIALFFPFSSYKRTVMSVTAFLKS